MALRTAGAAASARLGAVADLLWEAPAEPMDLRATQLAACPQTHKQQEPEPPDSTVQAVSKFAAQTTRPGS